MSTSAASKKVAGGAVKSVSKFKYPKTRKSDHVYEMHGNKIADPFDWLEDPDSKETEEWVTEQNKLSRPYMDTAIRKTYHERFSKLYNYPKSHLPSRRGSRYYQFQNTGLQNQNVLWRTSDEYKEGETLKKDTTWEVFMDPNKMSEDGTVALKSLAWTKDSKMLTYSTSKAGSDWMTIHFRDPTKADEEKEVIDENIKFTGMSWNGNSGIIYSKYPNQSGKADGTETTANEYQEVYYHKLGTDQKKDVIIVQHKDQPKWMSSVDVTYDQKALVLDISESCEPVNQIWVAKKPAKESDITKDKIKWLKIVDNFDAQYRFMWKEGNTFYFRTNLKAPKSRIISCEIDLDKESSDVTWKEVIPESEKNVIEAASFMGGKFLVYYMEDCKNTVYLYELDGKLNRQVPVPIGGVGCSGSKTSTEFFVKVTSFMIPGTIYQGDIKDGKALRMYHETAFEGVDLSNFTTEQVFVESDDGTKVPMFITYKKGTKKNGTNPTLVYGYGGFNIPLLPSFQVTKLIWMNHFNGIYVLTNIRGGGEYGQDWHKGGLIATKQNCFTDFQACTKYMIDEKWTNRDKVVIQGGSNGGTLVSTCANQTPELFGAVLCHVPVTDMYKFHKWTIGHAWVSDFGSPDKKDEFGYIQKWCPLHNVENAKIKDKHFPALLICTADHDDRVVPAHSFKYAAEVQRVLGEKVTNPLLIRVEVKAGHGAGKPTSKIIDEQADIYAFTANALGLKWIETEKTTE